MTERLHTCINTVTTYDGRPPPPCEACQPPTTLVWIGETRPSLEALTAAMSGRAPVVPMDRVADLLAVARRDALLEARAACVAYLNQEGLAEESDGAEECIARIDALLAKERA